MQSYFGLLACPGEARAVWPARHLRQLRGVRVPNHIVNQAIITPALWLRPCQYTAAVGAHAGAPGRSGMAQPGILPRLRGGVALHGVISRQKVASLSCERCRANNGSGLTDGSSILSPSVGSTPWLSKCGRLPQCPRLMKPSCGKR